MTADTVNWAILVAFGAAMYVISPRARGKDPVEQFFGGRDEAGRETSGFFLTSSVLISWIFAKSVQNAADLGQKFGFPGGAAYAAYWLSFIVAGLVLYRLRRAGFRSIHHYLGERYGAPAIWLFSLILLFRLWNEIWSNTIVMAQYFGPRESPEYYAASWAITALVLAYVLKGGLRSSIVTDTVQMAVAAVILFLILAYVFPAGKPRELVASGSWTLAGGVDLVLVALLQIFSYPFHDPVMTDRAFITEPRKMLRSFATAGVLGVLFILLFSFVGIYNRAEGIGGNATLDTAAAFGLPLLFLMNLMMLTSGCSTIDSTFSSIGKLVSLEMLSGWKVDKVLLARGSMVLLGILGNLMLYARPAILSATTVSGTMVIGLTPVFLLSGWRRAGAASYHASVLLGMLFGLGLSLKWFHASIGTGKYGTLLWVNLVGIALCFGVYAAGAWLRPAAAPERER
ncbi:MAG: sodium:solute symporter family transporter [Verrucomicrobiota bacterium]